MHGRAVLRASGPQQLNAAAANLRMAGAHRGHFMRSGLPTAGDECAELMGSIPSWASCFIVADFERAEGVLVGSVLRLRQPQV